VVSRRAEEAEGVAYLGPVSARDFITELDVLLISSRIEGLPRVLLEAALCRVPVVAPSVGAIPEYVVEGRTGWLFPPSASPSDVAQAIGRAWAADRRAAGERLLSLVKEKVPTREQYAKAHASIYEQVLRDQREALASPSGSERD
jgi:glycosyltransferase involved in cell wall biosynthesis